MKNQKSKPLFVAISDVHYSLKNLELSDRAFRAAIDKAAELKVPLVDCGDLTNDKAILRGEIVNRLIDTFEYAVYKGVNVYCLVGNHSLVNEKGTEHVLNFLRPYAEVVDFTRSFDELPGVVFIPYQSNPEDFAAAVKQRTFKGEIVVCHQGVKGAMMGDYVQDKSAVDIEQFKGLTFISGHYHKHQTVGPLTYVGNPFTMSFGEAKDGPKGFLVVNQDGTYTRELLNFREHVIYEVDLDDYKAHVWIKPLPHDIVWVKVRGPAMALNTLKKSDLVSLVGHSNFKLDKLPTEPISVETAKPLTDYQTLDALIDNLGESPENKKNLKALWRELVS